MHGLNRIRKYEADPENRYQVAEIFYTLQGEGPHSGLPAVFLRLTGCNLRCWFCDTAWDDDNDPYRSTFWITASIYRLTRGKPCSLLVITGGEPARQNLAPLVHAMGAFFADWRIQLETAGTLWQPAMADPQVELVVSPKTPAIHPEVYERAAAFKYVVRAGEVGKHGLPLYTTQASGKTPTIGTPAQNPWLVPATETTVCPPRLGAPVYLSPCDEDNSLANEQNHAAVAQLALEHGYRAGVQLHKVLGLR